MSQPEAAPPVEPLALARLDDAVPVPLDPAIWTQNLAALSARDAERAAALADAALPPAWRPVRALDGAAHWRMEAPDAPAAWLAQTAVPALRAAAQIAAGPSLHNHLLSGVGSGCEFVRLLARLAPWQAVIALVDDPAALGAVLRIHPVDMEIRAGRLVFVRVPPATADADALAAALDQALRTLLAPTVLHRLPGCAADRWTIVEAACRQCATARQKDRDARLRAAVAASRAGAHAARERPAIGVFVLAPWTRSAERAARDAFDLDAPEDRPFDLLGCIADTPTAADVSLHAGAIASAAPALSIFVGCAATSAGSAPRGAVCRWHLRAADVPPAPEGPPVIHLAASPRVADALRGAGVESARIVEFQWAAPPRSALPAYGAARPAADCPLLLVADLPNDTDAACGIEQPTHRRIWSAAREAIAAAWDRDESPPAAEILRRAQNSAGMTIDDREIRGQMLRLIEDVLIPTVVLEKILRALELSQRLLGPAGRGWSRVDRSAIADPAEAGRLLAERGAAAVFAGAAEPDWPALLAGLASGWPAAAWMPRAMRDRARDLPLPPERYYAAFSTRSELDALLARPPQPPVRDGLPTYAHRRKKLFADLGRDLTG